MIFAIFTLLFLLKKTTKYPIYLTELTRVTSPSLFYKSAFIITFLSLAGIPPFLGFFIKLYLFLCAIDVGYYIALVVGFTSSAISTFYYLRVIKLMEFETPSTIYPSEYTKCTLSFLLLYICSFSILTYVLAPNFFFAKLYQLILLN